MGHKLKSGKVLHVVGSAAITIRWFSIILLLTRIMDSAILFKGFSDVDWNLISIHPALPITGLIGASILLYLTRLQRLPLIWYTIPVFWMITELAILWLIWIRPTFA